MMKWQRIITVVFVWSCFLGCQEAPTQEEQSGRDENVASSIGKSTTCSCESEKESLQKALASNEEVREALESEQASHKSTMGELSDCKKKLPDLESCQSSLESAIREKEAATQQIADIRESLDTAQLKIEKQSALLAQKEERIQELETTPEMKILALNERMEQITSSDSLERLENDLDSFLVANGTSPQAREAKKLLKKLKLKKKKILEAEAEQKAMAAIQEIRDLLTAISDGDLSVPHLVAVSDYLESNSMGYDAILKLPRANYREAVKDPDSERGKSFKIRGTVIQVQKDGNYFTGLIGTGGHFGLDRIYYFVTPGTTKGIYQNKRASFTGVFLQNHEYHTRGNTYNHACVVAGYFKGQ